MKLLIVCLITFSQLTWANGKSKKEHLKPNENKVVLKKEIKAATAHSDFDHSHALFTKVLQSVATVNGPVTTINYKKLKTSPNELNNYLMQLSAVNKKTFQTWSRQQQQAFLINAYNAFTLKLIIKHYPVKSIKKIGGFFSNPWKIKFFHLLEEETYLDHIEHGILRKKYNEPRVHFAVNCASIGCPALRGEAFTAEKLNDQLNEQAKLFLRDQSRNKLNSSKKELQLSKIFDWFEEDFTKNGSTVAAFVAPHITDDKKIQEDLKKGLYSVSHLSYDWGLNESK